MSRIEGLFGSFPLVGKRHAGTAECRVDGCWRCRNDQAAEADHSEMVVGADAAGVEGTVLESYNNSSIDSTISEYAISYRTQSLMFVRMAFRPSATEVFRLPSSSAQESCTSYRLQDACRF